jgi:2'-hydroxyisoflavone reductase
MHEATRRTFLATSLTTGATLALGSKALAAPRRRVLSNTPQRILILGGTGFLGPACMEAALAAGHKVTLFNRGFRETMRKEKGRPSVVPEGVEVLYGNRDPEKTADDWKDDLKKADPTRHDEKNPNSPKGLSQLEGKTWDAVIDTSGYFPRIVKASTELLAPRVRQYVFISTISVYKNNSKPGQDEAGELGQLSDPNTEEFGADFSNYGPGKAACEAMAEKVMPGRVTNIRPGFIVGIRDNSARFIYWPLRAQRAGEVLVPGAPTDPIQIIDVRDLAEWVVHCIEENVTGVYNATGPEKELTVQAMLDGCAKGAGTSPTYTYVPYEWLTSNAVQEGEFPLVVPPTGESAGFHRISISRALAKGLKFRPVAETCKETLAWYKTLPPDAAKAFAKTTMTPAREETLLADFKASKKVLEPSH